VVADVLVVFVAVLVVALGGLPGRGQVAVAVGVHSVTGAEDAGQGAGDGRVGEEVGQLGDCGEDVVAGISLGGEDFFGLGAHGFVEGRRKRGLYCHIAICYEVLHLRIVEKLHLLQFLVEAKVVGS